MLRIENSFLQNKYIILNKNFMQVSVLTDNHAGPFTPAEHGLSYFIEYDSRRILFDTGQSDMFRKNSGLMKVDLSDIDLAVLSHGHFDHGNGLEFLDGGRLICHPGCFVRRYRKSDRSYIGLKNSQGELAAKFEIHTSSEPVRVTEKIIFLGEVPRLTEFESRTTPFIFEDGMPDFVMDDSGIVLNLPEGLFIISGCGHSGLVNMVEYAKKVTGIKKISGVMGGFHLKGDGLQTRETIRYLQENKVSHVLPSHCNDLAALSAFYQSFGFEQVKTGNIYKFSHS
jgi:7,8-dihydropterin-6-yl-methyl-4-(beta-D-ribofuranosyl)aminobenzene 5'-phosphate synthase